jgi:CNT family concentrative nucleoside transporter
MLKSIVTRIGIAILGFVALNAHVAAQTDDKAGNPTVTKARDIGKAAPNSNDHAAPAHNPRVSAGPVEAVRLYRFPIGPWSWDVSVPESVDLPDIVDRFRGFLGMLAILGVAAFLSDNRQAISRRVVLWGLALQ